MKAVLCKEYGPPEGLVIEETASKPVGKGEVRVALHAAGVNFPDVLIIQGKYQFKPQMPFSPGGEAAGLKPRARIRAAAVIGSEPTIMLTGPTLACRKALKQAGMSAADHDHLETSWEQHVFTGEIALSAGGSSYRKWGPTDSRAGPGAAGRGAPIRTFHVELSFRRSTWNTLPPANAC